MARNYELLLQILKKWPVDKKKGTRCFGFHLRELSRNGFPSGNIFEGDERENYAKLMSLQRLVSNKYAEKYPYRKERGASGFSLEEIKLRLSDTYVDQHLVRLKS